MDFLEDPPFPACPSFGFVSEPMYRVTVITTAGGRERRNRHWSRPLHRYTATVTRHTSEVSDLLEFYHAVGGRAFGFRFKDWVEYKSCKRDETATALDQPLLSLANSAGEYQLIKLYEYGVLQQIREITKPISGTILLADNGVEKDEGTDFEVDYTTGLVVLNFSPVGSLTWGGEFDVPARFDSELPVEISNLNIQSCQFSLMELRLNELEES